MKEKNKIYYIRTYRHLKASKTSAALYLIFFVLPCLLLLILYLDKLTGTIAEAGVRILERALPGIWLNIRQDVFSILNTIEYIALPATWPEFWDICMNLLAMCLAAAVLITGKRKGNPVSIFLLLTVFIHTINCVYFLFAADYFPYNATEFSELYMKQQIGIWITFLVLSGVITAFLGTRQYIYKILTVLAIVLYSIVFGAVRYILFLYLLHRFSMIYMALMFFVFGPLFDFMYFVEIYAVFANRIGKIYHSGKEREKWEWL